MSLDRKLMQDITIESAPAYLVLDALNLYKYSCLNEMIVFFIFRQREAILTFIEEQDICKHPKYVQAISRVVDYLGILEVGCRVVYNVDPLNL